MVKLGQIARKVGKNLASLVVGASTLIGASNVNGLTNDIYSVSDVVPDGNPTQRTVYYNSNDIKFNGRISRDKIILFYVYDTRSSPTDNPTTIRGGLTIQPNSSLDATNSYLVMLSGKVPTNGLNGVSRWIGGHDLNGNGKVGTYTGDSSSWSIIWEPGEEINTNQVSFSNMPMFPTSGTGPVSIASIRINGYQDFNTNNVPDYFEAKYPTIIGRPLGNDEDNDGHKDYEEWIAGTNPTNSADYFSVKSFDNGTNTFALNIGNTLEGRLYDVAASTNLTDSSSWTNKVYNFAGNGTNTLYIEKDPANKQEFYKPSVKLAPGEVVHYPGAVPTE